MKTNLLFAATLASMAITGTGAGVAGAVSSSNTPPRNRIARYTIREERLNVEAEVLGTTPSDLEDKLKTETMEQVITSAGLDKSTFRHKVHAKLQSDLLAKGYSWDQINRLLNRPGRGRAPSTA
ncbi:MAG TPA: hypothetical protein VFH39_02445 [Candidatus Saccharimonadales bacterium]|jgi:hypothetical protein|nr:hypothetical protein [Candidatus Saccharimonadales bacterium]